MLPLGICRREHLPSNNHFDTHEDGQTIIILCINGMRYLIGAKALQSLVLYPLPRCPSFHAATPS